MLTNKLTGAGAADKTYIEDVFSTYLYTGNGLTQTINNGIDLAGQGGMVWIKNRLYSSGDYRQHTIQDTVRGTQKYLLTNSSQAEGTLASYGGISSFDGNGYSVSDPVNEPYASWTFRKAPKFFDVVTFSNPASVSHSLGQVPAFVLVKRTNSARDWLCVHRASNGYFVLNTTAAAAGTGVAGIGDLASSAYFKASATTFDARDLVGTTTTDTYVAYLFAHDTSTDGLIQCGSYTGNGSATGPSVTLGWEPQYLMIKNASGTGNWQIIDSMRGMSVGSADATLQANLSNAESSVDYVSPTATGFQVTSTSTEVNTSGSTYIYMAIRRGPMRTPTDGTNVFNVLNRTGTNVTSVVNTTITPDLLIHKPITRTGGAFWLDRLRSSYRLSSDEVNGTLAESDSGSSFPSPMWDNQNGYDIAGSSTTINSSSHRYANWLFRRAPGFFDVVCYTGKGTNYLFEHNLKVVPELVFIKHRNSTSDWIVYSANVGNDKYLTLNSPAAAASSSTMWDLTTPIETHFQIGTNTSVNTNGGTYVWYGFASCPGVSKVFSFTGNGSSQTINCGFTNGARLVLIKRTDSTGDWYVWDTARGIVAGNDPHLSLNSTAAEVTTNDTIDPESTGFIVNQVSATNVNVNGASYIGLAIA